MNDTDPLLTGPQVAGQLGITAATWRGYVAKGYAPPPDDPDDGRPAERRSPRWRQSTIDRWRPTRPGQGRARTDLNHPTPPAA